MHWCVNCPVPSVCYACVYLVQCEYTFRVQMLEIYNEVLRDLLVDGRSGGQNRLDILATQASGCNVPGATQVGLCWCVRERSEALCWSFLTVLKRGGHCLVVGAWRWVL